MHTENALRAKSYKELQKIARAHPEICRGNVKQAEMLEALVTHFCSAKARRDPLGLSIAQDDNSGPTKLTPVCVAKDGSAATRSSDEAARDETPMGDKTVYV
jgi:hypothetical protein